MVETLADSSFDPDCVPRNLDRRDIVGQSQVAHREDRVTQVGTMDRVVNSTIASVRDNHRVFVAADDSVSVQASGCVLDDSGTLVRQSGCDHLGKSPWDGNRSTDVRHLQAAIDVNCLVQAAS